MISDSSKCVDCQRCVSLCPSRALKIEKSTNTFRENANWSSQLMKEVYLQAQSGGVLLSSMGNPAPLPVYWDKILINASQVTNPPIDPLREPMETRVFLGAKPENIQRDASGHLVNTLPPQLELELPIMFSAMSYGSISYNAHASLARAAEKMGTFYNTGEGGLHEDFYRYGDHTIVQVASGRFGVYRDYLEAGAAIEIKMGQGAKPGIGGHLPGAKVGPDVSKTRMIPEGSDAISPAPHHDIYSIEDLRQLVFSLKEATEYKKPVIVKVAAVNNIAAIASGIARSGADIIAIDGFRGGTGAAPTRIRDNVGIPVELALAFDESGDFSFRFPLSSLCIAYSGGLERIQEFAALLRELAKESGYFDFFKRRPFFIRPISKRPAKPSVPVRSLRCWKPNSGRGSTPTVMWSPR